MVCDIGLICFLAPALCSKFYKPLRFCREVVENQGFIDYIHELLADVSNFFHEHVWIACLFSTRNGFILIGV